MTCSGPVSPGFETMREGLRHKAFDEVDQRASYNHLVLDVQGTFLQKWNALLSRPKLQPLLTAVMSVVSMRRVQLVIAAAFDFIVVVYNACSVFLIFFTAAREDILA